MICLKQGPVVVQRDLHCPAHRLVVARPTHTAAHSIGNQFSNLNVVRSRSGVAIGSLVGCRSATAEAHSAPGAESSPVDDLGSFLSWLVANGVLGIGQEDSKVALFEADGGERGLVCEEPIAAGEVVFEVPLRLALTDHPGDDESNQLMYEGAPWSVRLACKLLRQRAAGKQSPWSPYIRVLPRTVPAPLETFGWEDIAALRYPTAEAALHSADWLRADALASTSEEARGGCSDPDFNWAMSVVHSRTFANAAPGGGVGVRMLVPLIDMLNHGGDEAQPPQAPAPGLDAGAASGLGLNGRTVATDNVRWDLVPPNRSATGGWAMVVSATRPLQPGQEAMLSYGERPNDDFFLHYGFVPRANPHDDAVLWSDLEAALEWHYMHFGQQMGEEQAEPLYRAALEAGVAEQEAELALRTSVRKKGGSGSGSGSGSAEAAVAEAGTQAGFPGQEDGQQGQELPEEVLRQLKQVKVVVGGQVSAAVVRAFATVGGGDTAAAERAVACRCAELLWDMSQAQSGADVTDVANSDGDDNDAADTASVQTGGLLVDLAGLLADADPRIVGGGANDEEAGQLSADAEYWAAQLRGYCQVLVPRFVRLLPEGAIAAAAMASASASARSVAASTAATARPVGLKSKYGLPPPATTASASTPAAAAASPSPAPTSTSLPLGPLVRGLLTGPSMTTAAALQPLTAPQRLSTAFRASKQMVLWDVLLGSGVGPEELATFVRR